MLKVEKLSKKVNGKTILNNLDFEIHYGQIGIILGGSGAGKSTLLRVLNHLEHYESGSLTLDGDPLCGHKQSVGMVFQHFNLFEHLNAEDNIVCTLTNCKGMAKREAKEAARKILGHYGLQEHAHTYVNCLSGGQKQRLAIARTVAVNPKVICLDEPTSALDPRLTSQVAELICTLAKGEGEGEGEGEGTGKIVLVTTHDMQLLEQLDGQLLLMQEGVLIEKAAKEDYINNRAAYPQLGAFLPF